MLSFNQFTFIAFIAFITLAECLIRSSTTPWAAHSHVDKTCHGDVLAFDGNLWIAGRGMIVFNASQPVDDTALLFFQNDGAKKFLFFFCFFILVNSNSHAGNLLIQRQNPKRFVWHVNFSAPERGPFVGVLQLDLVRRTARAIAVLIIFRYFCVRVFRISWLGTGWVLWLGQHTLEVPAS